MSGFRCAVFAALCAALAPAAAQGSADRFPAANSNEARTMAIFAVPLAFSGAGGPGRESDGTLSRGARTELRPECRS